SCPPHSPPPEEGGGPGLPYHQHARGTGGRGVPPVVLPTVMRDGVMPRAAVAGLAPVPGRPLGVRGNPGNAMCRPMQEAAERVLVCHLHPPMTYEVRMQYIHLPRLYHR